MTRIPSSEPVSDPTIMMEQREVLQVEGAWHLPRNADLNVIGHATDYDDRPDAYVIVRVIHQQADGSITYKGLPRRSEYKTSTADPRWYFYADIKVAPDDYIVAEVYDYDQNSRDDLVGLAVITIDFLDSGADFKRLRLFTAAEITAHGEETDMLSTTAHRIGDFAKKVFNVDHLPGSHNHSDPLVSQRIADAVVAKIDPAWVNKVPAEGEPSISLCRLGDGCVAAVPHNVTVYFIRHAQSNWNEAQTTGNVKTMVANVDHSLSEAGVQQCKTFNDLWRDQKANGDDTGDHADEIAEFLRANTLFVSPLTRAMQTSLVALAEHPVLAPDPPVHTAEDHFWQDGSNLILLAAAREIKQFGGQDTVSNTLGADILNKATDDLAKTVGKEEAAKLVATVKVDTHDATSQWWTNGSDWDSDVDIEARFCQMLSSLRFHKRHDSEHPTLVVSHSLMIREFCRRYMCQELRESDGFAKALTVDKLDNVNMIRCVVEFGDHFVGDCKIVEAKAVFGAVTHHTRTRREKISSVCLRYCGCKAVLDDEAEDLDRSSLESNFLQSKTQVKVTNPLMRASVMNEGEESDE